MPLGTASFWGVVLPSAGVNLLRNPSAERNTTDWNDPAVGFIAGRKSDAQAFGAFSVVTPGLIGGPIIGCTIGPFTAGAGTAYTTSIYLKASGESMKIGVGNNADVTAPPTYQGTSAAFTVGGGTWQRYSFSYTEASGGARYLTILAAAGAINNGTVYMDGAQVEVGSQTTYIDGDQDGCYWTGAPHLSSSVRSGTYRGGGTVLALADLGFRVDASPGIGMPPLETTSQSFALIDGAEFQRQRAKERTFTLESQVVGTTWKDLHVTRRTVINALKIDLVSPQQPTRFLYVGGQGTVRIDAVVDAGLEFHQTPGQGFTEIVGVRFIAHDPFWYAATDQGTALAPRVSIGSTNYIAKRDPLGRWGTLGANGTTIMTVPNAALPDTSGITDLALNSGGTLFMCGSWGSVAGTQSPNVAMYFPTANTFGTLAGGTLGHQNGGRCVRSLLFSPAGSLYVAGDFGTAAGTAAVAIAQWNGAWGTLTGGTVTGLGVAGTSVRALGFSNGTLFFAGRFAEVGGTSAGSVAQWVNGAFGTLGAGIVGFVRDMTIGLDGAVYVVGNLTSAAGTTVNDVARWSGAWGSMGTGFYGGQANAIGVATEPNGKIVAVGAFNNSDPGTTYNAAEWNGISWSAMGSGLFRSDNIDTTWVTTVTVDQNTGDIYAGGAFNVAGGISVPDGFARWNGYAWLPIDIDVTGQGTFNAILLAPDQTLYAAGSFAGTARAAAVAQIYNAGMSEAYPTIKVRTTGGGTARLFQVVNTYPTGDGVYFNYTIQPGEEVTLETEPGQRSFTSSYVGNIFGKIIGGSNIASFRLLPGTNWISLFCDSDNVAASIYWRPRSWSADGGTVF